MKHEFHCPVCGRENETLQCIGCGFDGSRDYEQLPTLCQIPDRQMAISARIETRKDLVICTQCGGDSFRISRKRGCICVSCDTAVEIGLATKPEMKLPAPREQSVHRGMIAAGYDNTVGILPEGRVVVAGYHRWCNAYALQGCVSVRAGSYHAVGLRRNGTVIATGDEKYGKCQTKDWKEIIDIACGYAHTVGLKKDGSVVTAGRNDLGQCNVFRWRDIVAISAGDEHTVGLKQDGTVVAAGTNKFGQCEVSSWKDIVAISAGTYITVGLRKDGTVVTTGRTIDDGYTEITGWRNIVAIAAGFAHVVGLKRDGTVVAAGGNQDGQCNTGTWRNIVAIAAGAYHTVGLKANGTVVAAGSNDYGQCNVSDWKLGAD